MSEQSESVLRQSLDSVDQFRRRTFVVVAFVIVVWLVVFTSMMASIAESRTAPAAIKVLYAVSVLQMIVIAACTAVIQVSMTRMTRILLRAIELTSGHER
jgi:hypothetical protein